MSERKRALHARRSRFLYALAVALAAWLVVIFVFSAQPAAESGQVSGGISYRIVSLLNRALHFAESEEALLAAAAQIDFPVRKCAHMSEYGVLAIMIFALVACFRWRIGAWGYFLALMLTFLYACTDEYHQRFVPGRSGSFTDVMIDTAGAAIALVLLFLFLAAYRCRRRRRARRERNKRMLQQTIYLENGKR